MLQAVHLITSESITCRGGVGKGPTRVDLAHVRGVYLAVLRAHKQVLVREPLCGDSVLQSGHCAGQHVGLLHGDGAHGRVGGPGGAAAGCSGGQVRAVAPGARGGEGRELGVVNHSVVQGRGRQLGALGLKTLMGYNGRQTWKGKKKYPAVSCCQVAVNNGAMFTLLFQYVDTMWFSTNTECTGRLPLSWCRRSTTLPVTVSSSVQ